MKKTLTSIFGLVLMSSVTFQAYAGGVTQESKDPPLVVPGGVPTITIPNTIVPGAGVIPRSTPSGTGVVVPDVFDYCTTHRTIVMIVHIGNEKVEVEIPNPLCP